MTSARRRRAWRFPVKKGVFGAPQPPFGEVQRLGAAGKERRPWLAWIIALGLYGPLLAVTLWAPLPEEAPLPAPPITQSVTMEPLPTEPAPPAPTPVSRHVAPPAPPAAAQASSVVAAPAAPAGPVDMTDFAMPAGKSDNFASGMTAAAGKSDKAVTAPDAQAKGEGAVRDAEPARHDWTCAWPESEQGGTERDVRVRIRVRVDKDGAPENVEIVGPAKDSFAQTARACALREAYAPARDSHGARMGGPTAVFVVHFVR